MRAARAKRGDRATPTEEGDAQESLSKGSYAQVLELEQLLLTTIQAKGPFDPNVRILRSNIRELFEAIILEDHEFAELHDVEQSLWRLHHTCIEEFRARIRKSTAASGNKPAARREPVQKLYAVFRSYLAEATGFYHDLILKIGAKHGLSQDDLTYSSVNDKNIKKDDKRTAELRRCHLSCHRCLIFLGDLARYKEFYGEGDGKSHDWSIAAGFYVKAASMWPASGNPYNQLAVLATYIGDEMLAVYYYFRSLASEAPFLTAKDNLILLFDKNRHSYSRLVASSAGNASQTAKAEPAGKGILKGETQVSQEIGNERSGLRQGDSQSLEQKAAVIDFMKSFRVHFVRLNGILFTRTSVEAFLEVHSSVLSDLEELLMIKETDEEAVPSSYSLTSGRNWGTGPNVLLQLISILIFSVHNIMGSGHDSHQPTYAAILQRSVVLAHALVALFECVGYILQHCTKLDDPSNSLLLPAIVVVMEWLSCRPEITVGSEIKEKEGTARLFFWKNCVNFLNRFTTGDTGCLAADEVNDRITLWEDFELWGFTPLLPIQHKLDYAKRPDMGLGSLRDRLVRVQRLRHAGKVISSMFDGSDKGMHYDVKMDMFYLMGEKKLEDRKQVEVVSSVNTLEAPPLRSVKDSKNFKPMAGAKSTSTKVTLPVEEEDEEVIVFKPSSKSKDLFKPAFVGEALIQESLNTSSDSLSNTTELDDLVGPRRTPSAPHSMVAPSMVTSVSSSSVLPSISSQNLQPLSANLGAQVSGSLNDFSASQAVKGASLDLNPGNSSHLHGLSLDGLGLFDNHLKGPGSQFELGPLDKDLKAPGSQFEPGRLSGSTVDWGSGTSFSMQPSRNLIPPLDWQPHDGVGSSSLWSSEHHKLASARDSFGVQSGPSLAMVKRFPFMDPSLESLQSMALTSAAQYPSESPSMPVHSMEPHVLGALVQMKPRVQEPLNVIADKSLGSLLAVTQDSSILGAKLKLNSGVPSDGEKRRVAPLPSNMRPPPGFGPLPAKPPVSLSATLAFQASQPLSSGYPPASASRQQSSALDQSGGLSVEEHVDDYAWLDGYTPPKKETNQSFGFGLSRGMGNSNFGWSTGAFNPTLDATISPFPGMKTLDRFLSPPPFPAPPQQPPLSQALLQQELLHKQQTPEQYQQQLFQEQRLQQFYNAQLAAQRNQIPQGEQQQPQPLLQQPPLSLPQQLPQSLWPGQNSFVS